MRSLTGVVCVLGFMFVAGYGLFHTDNASSAGAAVPTLLAAPVPLPADEAAPVEESMHEFMEYVFQPSYRRLKSAMATVPADNNGWKAIKAESLTLAECCNLLYGRKPAEHGDDWIKHATASRSAGAELYGAARVKDFAKATTAYKLMLNNCNACHKQFENGKHILQP